MSEYMAAEIWIGGKAPAALVPELCRKIGAERVGLECGDNSFAPAGADELLAACEIVDGVRLLHLFDDQARWGEFRDLEMFLQAHGVAYRRITDGKWDYDPELIEFRPESGVVVCATNHSGQPTVDVASLRILETRLIRAAEKLHGGAADSAERVLRRAIGFLRRQLPPVVPPLAPFEIVDTEHDE